MAPHSAETGGMKMELLSVIIISAMVSGMYINTCRQHRETYTPDTCPDLRELWKDHRWERLLVLYNPDEGRPEYETTVSGVLVGIDESRKMLRLDEITEHCSDGQNRKWAPTSLRFADIASIVTAPRT